MASRLDRREFLRMGAGLAGLGGASAFGLQLAAAGAAAGASTVSGYKALVCVFLQGGNDANNMVLATDGDSWGRYWAARNQGEDPIALMPAGTPATPIGQINSVTGRVSQAGKPESWGGVLPITPRTAQAIPAGTNATNRTFALHPMMAPVQSLFNAGRIAVLANVGALVQPTTKAQYLARSAPLPANLFSHNDQQSVWQAGAIEGATIGWGGQMGDLLASMNGANTIFTGITTSGAAVFLSGRQIVQYPLTTGALPAVSVNGVTSSLLFGSNSANSTLSSIIQDASSTSDFANNHAAISARSVAAAGLVNQAFNQSVVSSIPAVPVSINPNTGAVQTNALAVQLNTVARMIAAAPSLGLQRQVFMVEYNAFDSHDTQNLAHSNNMAMLSQALSYFDNALSNIGGSDLRQNVTTFTASDFSRTFNTNGLGTDHAWGGHHLIMGGAVKGGDMYGQYPTLGMDMNGFVNPDGAGASLVPTTSVDQYAATLGAWFGVGASDLATIFPNLKNYNTSNLGFV